MAKGRLKRAAKITAAIAVVLLCALAAWLAQPLPKELLSYQPVASVRILDRQGGLLRELHSTADGRGRPIKLDDLPDNVQNAFLAAEDGSFYRHPGIAPWAIARAAVQNIEAGRIVAGGST
ncbi:MAG: transglycosylase domain-containing protein, partial [Myxococcaceae bacterium]